MPMIYRKINSSDRVTYDNEITTSDTGSHYKVTSIKQKVITLCLNPTCAPVHFHIPRYKHNTHATVSYLMYNLYKAAGSSAAWLPQSTSQQKLFFSYVLCFLHYVPGNTYLILDIWCVHIHTHNTQC